MRRTAPLLLTLSCLLVAGCGGDDDCYRERRCESIGGELTCVWVRVCPGSPDEVLSSRGPALLTNLPEGEHWDVRTEADEALDAEPGTVVGALLGDDVARRTGAYGYRQWSFHSWPAEWVRTVASGPYAAGIQQIERSADPRSPCTTCGDARALIRPDALPPLPARIAEGDIVLLHAPRARELVPTDGYANLVVYVTPPDDGPLQARVLEEGQSVGLPLERPGRWTVRIVVLTADLCDVGVADAAVIREMEIEVVAARAGG